MKKYNRTLECVRIPLHRAMNFVVILINILKLLLKLRIFVIDSFLRLTERLLELCPVHQNKILEIWATYALLRSIERLFN